MKRVSVLLFVAMLSGSATGAAMRPAESVVKINGWFSDRGCAAAKLAADEVTPNGTACVKKCLDDGVTPVFVDPKARVMYQVKDYPEVKNDVGYYLELTGVIDAKAKTISVRSVKHLGDVVQMCGRKPKKT
jgi:hypothetical protein